MSEDVQTQRKRAMLQAGKIILRGDWKDEAAYKAMKKFTKRKFAWEFIRRSKKYEKCWIEFQKTSRSVPPGEDLSGYQKIWGYDFGLEKLYDPSKSAAELGEQLKWQASVNDFSPVDISREYHKASSYFSGIEFKDADEQTCLTSTHYAVLAYDLRIPLQKQMVASRKTLKEKSKAWKHARKARADTHTPNNLIRYLRILDACALKTSNKKLLEYLDGIVPPELDADKSTNAYNKIAEQKREAWKIFEEPQILLL